MSEREPSLSFGAERQIDRGETRPNVSYHQNRILERVQREVGASWIPVTQELIRWKEQYGEDTYLIPQVELDAVRSLLPFWNHPFLDPNRRRQLALEGKLDQAYKAFCKLDRETGKALKLWHEVGLNPYPLFAL